MRMVRAGRLKDFLGIQQATETAGEYGGTNNDWKTIASRECEIKPQRASQFYQAAGDNVHNVVEIRFRYEEGLIREDYRLIDTTRSPNVIYDDITIQNMGNWDTEILITAVEKRWPQRD